MKATHSCTCAALLKKQKISWWVVTKTSGSWGCAWRKMQSLHSWLHCLMPLEKGTHKGEKTSHLFKFQVQDYDNTAFPQHYLLWKYIFLSYPKGHLVPFHTKYLPSSSMLSTQKKKTLFYFLNLTFTLYCFDQFRPPEKSCLLETTFSTCMKNLNLATAMHSRTALDPKLLESIGFSLHPPRS